MPSKSNKQARFMAACAHDADYENCPPEEVAKDFNKADKKSGRLKRAMKQIKTETMTFKQFLMLEGISEPGNKYWDDSVQSAKKEKKKGFKVDMLWNTHQNVRNKHMAALARAAGYTPTKEMLKYEAKAKEKQKLKEGISSEELADAIVYRLERQHPEVFSRYGDEVVGDVVADVADFHAGAEELGSSDLSIMVHQVMKQLEGTHQGMTESDLSKSDTYKHGYSSGETSFMMGEPIDAAGQEDDDVYRAGWLQGYKDARKYSQGQGKQRPATNLKLTHSKWKK